MKRTTSRNLCLVAFVVALLALIVWGTTLMFSSDAANTSAFHSVCSAICGFLVSLATLFAFSGWVGALTKTAQLHRWGWFTLLLLLPEAMLIYIFDGPDLPSSSSSKQNIPPPLPGSFPSESLPYAGYPPVSPSCLRCLKCGNIATWWMIEPLFLWYHYVIGVLLFFEIVGAIYFLIVGIIRSNPENRGKICPYCHTRNTLVPFY